VLDNYRNARDVSLARRDGGDVSTEDLRSAMVCYRALFTELVSTSVRPPAIENAKDRRGDRRSA
jgi:hypothetical protein